MRYPGAVTCLATALLLYPATEVWGAKGTLKINDHVFLNACGSNPDVYETVALNIKGKIVEVGNRVVKLDKSPYGRGIITSAESIVVLPNGKSVTTKMNNFRNFLIEDDSGKMLYKRKVSGTT